MLLNFLLLAVYAVIAGSLLLPLADSFTEIQIPPRHQWKEINDMDYITCKKDFVLLQKNNGEPACVSPNAYLKLVDRGYGLFDPKIMEKRPEMMNSLMQEIVSNHTLMNHWFDMMLDNPVVMQDTIMQWISKMKDNPKFLENVMGPMTSDQNLREKMIEHMRQHSEMEQTLKDSPKWMDSVHKPGDHMMEHTQNCPWCPDYDSSPYDHHIMGFTNSDRIMDMMHFMWINDEISHDMHELILEHPEHMAQMSEKMMGPVLRSMMDDPDLRDQMIELMLDNQNFMNSIRHENTG